MIQTALIIFLFWYVMGFLAYSYKFQRMARSKSFQTALVELWEIDGNLIIETEKAELIAHYCGWSGFCKTSIYLAYAWVKEFWQDFWCALEN